MNDAYVELVPRYGYPALVLVLVGAAFGLPLPATLLLIGEGAYASTEGLNLSVLLALSLASVVAGDFAGYWAGRLGGPVLLSRASRWLKVSRGGTGTWQASLDRWGGLTVFLTRFLLSPLGPAVNIVAGVERYRFRSFAFYDVAGEIVWVVLYAGLGYGLGSAAVALAGILGDVSAALAILVIVAGVLAYLAHEIAERHHRRLLATPTDSTPVNDLEAKSPG